MAKLNLESFDLQVNFTPEQRAYFDKLKAELLSLFAGKSYEEILASENAELLKKISDKLAQLQDFVQNKNIPGGFEKPRPWTQAQVVDWYRRAFDLDYKLAFLTVLNEFEFDGDYVIRKSDWVLDKPGYDLPECLWVKGKLDLNHGMHLPRMLKVDDACHFHGTSDMPEYLEVGGALFVTNGRLERFPRYLKVDGQLISFANCYISGLPENFHFSGRLSFMKCLKLATLPRGLEVESLRLQRTAITVLPDDIIIKDRIILNKSDAALVKQAEELRDRGQIGFVEVVNV